ncbi:hypothetical protein PLESTB_000492000 [Pleodorina starrii]|uniref:Uncharacterized protein n=1 Tax=Pleodorina starrii TaxID=330485 RepID=A0A9W6BFM0_9CHLO|nr:hypothetical protein PLESTM_000363500 [Pleodorina starrii]GLC51341.1 hypothetical protein PLESTB_000492000 [Pleodorina starrii]GLC63706.1 hypothetical protein PLESTF_000065500 [Pleodorina starrii]
MALPPLAPARSPSPDRGASPPTTTGSTPPTGITRLPGPSPLAPFRASLATDTPSPTAAAAAAASRASLAGALPARSASSAAAAAGGPPSPTPSASPSRRGSAPAPASPRVISGPRKLTPAQLAERLHGQLTEVLRTEWRRIKSSNLGVLSGTAVVEELLLRRIQSWAGELHMLAISTCAAAERLGALCRAMDGTELQQLLVMFDQTGHPDLSDFVRVMVFNTSDPAAKEVVGDLRALRAANSAGRRGRSSSGSFRRRAAPPPPPPPRFLVPVPDDPAAMRFAGLLPEGHRLVAGAHAAAERRRQQEEAERQAAEAREARAQARAQAEAQAAAQAARVQHLGFGIMLERQLSREDYDSSVLSGRGSEQELLPYYLADLEEQWRRTIGTRIKAEGVYDSVIMLHERLPMYEVPPDAALLRLEAEEAALAPPSRHGLGQGSTASRAAPSYSIMRGAGGNGGGGGTPWTGAIGSANATSALKRITSARPPSGRGPQQQQQLHSDLSTASGLGLGLGGEGSGPGSLVGSLRFTTGAGAGGGGGGGGGGSGGTAGGKRAGRSVVLPTEEGVVGSHGGEASGGGGGGGVAAEGSSGLGLQRGQGSATGLATATGAGGAGGGLQSGASRAMMAPA